MMDCFDYPYEIKKQLFGKSVLVIGEYRMNVLDKMFRDLNIDVILVTDDDNNQKLANMYGKIIKYPYTDKGKIECHASAIVDLVVSQTETVDGCLTFDDERLLLTSLVCKRLNLIGMEPSTVRLTKSKFEMFKVLERENSEWSFATKQYTTVTVRINNESDIQSSNEITFPAILKPEYGYGSIGVCMVHSVDDCVQKYRRLLQTYGKEWTGRGFGQSMILMNFLHGTKYNIDLIICNDELVLGLISEMGPALPRFGFLETTSSTPPNLQAGLKELLITAAFFCCLKVGIRHGIANVEMIVTSDGLKLVEINGRLASYQRTSVHLYTHQIDLHMIHVALACDLKPNFCVRNPSFSVGFFLYPKYHGKKIFDPATKEKLNVCIESKECVYIFRKNSTDVITEFPECFAHLVAIDNRSVDHARMKLLEICKKLDLLCPEFDVEKLTEHFINHK